VASEGFGFDVVIRPSQARDLLATTLSTVARRKTMQTVTPACIP